MNSEFWMKLACGVAAFAFVCILGNDIMLKAHITAEQNAFTQNCIKGTPLTDIDAYNKRLAGCREAAEKQFLMPDRLKPKH